MKKRKGFENVQKFGTVLHKSKKIVQKLESVSISVQNMENYNSIGLRTAKWEIVGSPYKDYFPDNLLSIQATITCQSKFKDVEGAKKNLTYRKLGMRRRQKNGLPHIVGLEPTTF